MSGPIPEAKLHAYVDGQLPAERAAEVARWLAQDEAAAALVAAWVAQREALRAGFAAIAAEPVPPRLDVQAMAGPGWRGAAACGRSRRRWHWRSQ